MLSQPCSPAHRPDKCEALSEGRAAGHGGTRLTGAARGVTIVLLIAAAGFLLALLIPRSDCVSVFGTFTQRRVKLAGVLRSQSDILVPTRALVQMSIVILCGIGVNLAALLGGKKKPD